jgi:hypothetical protein
METGYTSFGGAGGQKIKQGFEVLAGAESGAGAKKKQGFVARELERLRGPLH